MRLPLCFGIPDFQRWAGIETHTNDGVYFDALMRMFEQALKLSVTLLFGINMVFGGMALVAIANSSHDHGLHRARARSRASGLPSLRLLA
jgi:hypothetical protein